MANKKTLAIIFAVVSLLFLAAIWKGGDRELVWFLLPFGGLFWQIGGTWKKIVRRLFLPIAVGMAYFFFIGWTWWIPAIIGAYFATTTIPFTLKGDSIHDHWFNWVWIWIAGFLHGIAVLTLGIPLKMVALSLILTIVPTLTYGICGTLSNVPATKNWFVWKLCEFLFGVSVCLPPAMLIQQYIPAVIP